MKGEKMTLENSIDFENPNELDEFYARAMEKIRNRLKEAQSEFQRTLNEVMNGWEGNAVEKWLFGFFYWKNLQKTENM